MSVTTRQGDQGKPGRQGAQVLRQAAAGRLTDSSAPGRLWKPRTPGHRRLRRFIVGLSTCGGLRGSGSGRVLVGICILQHIELRLQSHASTTQVRGFRQKLPPVSISANSTRSLADTDPRRTLPQRSLAHHGCKHVQQEAEPLLLPSSLTSRIVAPRWHNRHDGAACTEPSAEGRVPCGRSSGWSRRGCRREHCKKLD